MKENWLLCGIDVGKNGNTICIVDMGSRQNMSIGNNFIATELVIAKNHPHCTSQKRFFSFCHPCCVTPQACQNLPLHLCWIQRFCLAEKAAPF